MKKLLLILCCVMFLSVVSAGLNFDNIATYDDKVVNDIGYSKYDIRNSILGIPFLQLDKVAELELIENSKTCSDCNALIPITLYEDGSLVDDARFYREVNGKWVPTSIRGYKFYTQSEVKEKEVEDYEWQCSPTGKLNINGTAEVSCSNVLVGTHTELTPEWIEYIAGTEVKAGDYVLDLRGEKNPFWKVDWQIKTNGVWTTEWAVWGAGNLTTNNLAYYKLDGNNFSDSTIYGNDITNTGTLNSSGKIIDGRNNSDGKYMTIPALGISGNANRTINLWVNPHIIEDGDDLVDSTGEIFDISPMDFGAGFWRTYIAGVGWVVSSVSSTDDIGTWVMISVTHNGTGTNLYRNGVSIANGTGTATSSDAVIKIGENVGGGQSYDGLVDEISIWNKSLTSEEIQLLYNSGSGFTYPYVNGEVILNSPTNNYISPSTNILFNSTATITGGATLTNMSLWTNSTGTWIRTNSSMTNLTTITSTFNQSLSSSILWTIEACDSDGDCGFATENRTLLFDITPPTINITNPTSIINYGREGKNQTLSWNITDTNLDSCWYNYNGTNTTVTCGDNTTNFQLGSYSTRTLRLWANDSAGNVNSSSRSWNYTVFENSQTFNNETTEGAIQNFSLNLTFGTTKQISQGVFNYNGTNTTTSITTAGNQARLDVSNFETPLQNATSNVSFFWTLTLDDSSTVYIDNRTQLVEIIGLDNCSTFTNKLFNISLFTERDKTPLNGTIELSYNLLNKPTYNIIKTLNGKFNNTSNLLVCSEYNLSSQNLAYSSEIKYRSNGYASELYHIQRADIESEAEVLNLYDLNSNYSTEFKVTYQDDSFVFVDGAIIQLQRKYISEGIYETVEAPLTSNEGTAILHIDLDTNKYRATVIKDGEILDEFDNLVFNCESPLVGTCTQKLLGTINPQNNINLDTLLDFSYSDPTMTNDTISVAFSVPSGSPSTISISLVQKDQYGNETLCNRTITSSAGSIECTYQESIGDSFIDLVLLKDGELVLQSSYIIPKDSGLNLLGNNFFIVLVFLLSLVGMAFTSPEWIIVNGVITFVVAGSLWLLNGMDFVVGLGSLMWLLVAAAILIFKLARQEDR